MKATVFIDLDAWRTIRRYVMASTLECSMLAEVETKDNAFLITKIYLPQQTRSPAYTKITTDGINALLSRKDVDPLKIKAWFHSHVNMGTTPSMTDKTQAAELMADCDWFICGIFNKKNEYSMYIHWMGMEIEANLEILFDADYDEIATKKELEDATITETITYVHPSAKVPKKPKKNEKHNTDFPWKTDYFAHIEQNPYITAAVHQQYEETINALNYNSVMIQIDKDLLVNPDTDDMQMCGCELYETYLDDVSALLVTSREAIEMLKERWEIIKKDPADWLASPWKYMGLTPKEKEIMGYE